MAHTPGPWVTNAIDGKPNAAAVWTTDGRLFICSTNRPPTRLHSVASESDQHANCCLIAAAPDLRAALAALVQTFHARPDMLTLCGPHEHAQIKAACDALNKAEPGR